MKKLAPIIGGGGGGKGDVISGGGTKTDQIDFLISESFKIVNEIF
jgi:alanyl-tRNA synthetase